MSSIGEILKGARTKKGISEEAAAKALKIKLERLRDLEADRYDQFAAYVYVRSFLRHYATFLEIDSAPLLEQFAKESPPPENKPIFEVTEEQRAHHAPAQNRNSALTPTGKIILVSVAVIVILISLAINLIKSVSNHLPPPEKPTTAFQKDSSGTPPPDLEDIKPIAGPTIAAQPLTLSTNQAPPVAKPAQPAPALHP